MLLNALNVKEMFLVLNTMIRENMKYLVIVFKNMFVKIF